MIRHILSGLLGVATVTLTLPALAGSPYRYAAACFRQVGSAYEEDTCTVIETRDVDGGLRTRNIFSNRFGLTIKNRWDGRRFVTWDSFNQFEYPWVYKVNTEIERDGVTGTLVMPGITVVNVSWD